MSSLRENSCQAEAVPASQGSEIDPSVEAARSAGLRYVSDTQPGIQRKRAGEHFRYIGVDGQALRDEKIIQRITALGIPPAWQDVWICPSERGHIQATGRDAKGRKQYRYHAQWRRIRDETKYDRMLAFGHALPEIRRRVAADLGLPGLPREKLLATLVRLLDMTAVRIGNEAYAKENNSFGLTTMREQHVEISGTHIRFHFRGKSGKEHDIDIQDRRLATIVRRCRDLPGEELFQYVDEHGQAHTIESSDVNDYLRQISGQDFSAKDFRTWTGTVAATCALQDLGPFETQTEAKKNVVRAIEHAASHLGNTPAICRKSYVHPEIINAYVDGSLLTAIARHDEQGTVDALHGLRPDELAVLAFLEK